MNKRKILIIGVGGIGSYLTPILSQTGLYDITISDPDIVEKKNFLYQNFCEAKLAVSPSKKKVDALELKGNVNRNPYPILTTKQIDGYDLVICCADNLDARRLLYKQGFGESCMGKWLDLRAQGRNAALISYLADKKYSDTFLSGPEGSFSCQGEEFNKTNQPSDIHFMHTAIAGFAAQWIQRWFNGEQVIDKMFING
jgi:molybdopterin/thiamine biosynthesis adenylyltransferase